MKRLLQYLKPKDSPTLRNKKCVDVKYVNVKDSVVAVAAAGVLPGWCGGRQGVACGWSPLLSGGTSMA